MGKKVKAQAIIPTAGKGVRFQSDLPKPLIFLKEKPIFIRTLEVFAECADVDSAILIVHADYISEYEKLLKQFRLDYFCKITIGGSARVHSVANGLKLLDKDTEIVIVHDGVRPLIRREIIEQAITACHQDQAVVVAVPVKSTIKKINNETMTVEETIDRSRLWEIQTPQVFKQDLLQRAYQQEHNASLTDDAMMVENLGERVKIIRGDYSNIKITTQEDLVAAQAYLTQILSPGKQG